MKFSRILLAALVLALLAPLALQAAAPLHTLKTSAKGDFTLTGATNDSFVVKDSVIIVITDSATVMLEVTGCANLGAGSALLIGSSRTSKTACDSVVQISNYGGRMVERKHFTYRFFFNYSSQTDLTDTIYFNIKPRSKLESIGIEDFVVSAFIGDNG